MDDIQKELQWHVLNPLEGGEVDPFVSSMKLFADDAEQECRAMKDDLTGPK